jgi:hypothetical protein
MEAFDIFVIVGTLIAPVMIGSLGFIVGAIDGMKEKEKDLYDN